MLEALLGAAISGGMGMLGAGKQAKAEKYAADQNFKIAQMNADLQREINDKQLGLSREQIEYQRNLAAQIMEMQQEGSIDANGNQVRYVPGKGMVSTLGAQTGAINEANNREQLLRTMVDQANRRSGMEQNAVRRGTEGQYADQLMSEMQQPSPYNKQSIEDAMIRSGTRAVNQGYDATLSPALRAALRSGTNSGNIVAKVGRERAASMQDVTDNAIANSGTQFEGLEGARTARLGNQYNNMASRASNFDDAAFAPNTLVDTLSAQAANKGNAVNQAGYMGRDSIQLNAGRAPTLDYTYKPNASNDGSMQRAGGSLFNTILSGLTSGNGGGSSSSDRTVGNQKKSTFGNTNYAQDPESFVSSMWGG